MTPEIDLAEIDVKSVSEAELPKVIRTQCEILDELEQKLEVAFRRAYGAQRSADAAASVKVGVIRGKKEAIKASQRGLKDVADANAANTEAIQVVYEYQKQIAVIMKWFISLGTTSLAMNRATINQLQAILKEGTSVRLSDATRAELKGVIRDLKAQEDFMQKQAKTETTVKGHEKRLIKVEKRQKFLFGGIILVLLLVVVIGAIGRVKVFTPSQATIEVSLPTPSSAPSDPLETEGPVTSPASALPEFTDHPIQEQRPVSTDSSIQVQVEESAPQVPSDAPSSNNVVLPEESIAPQVSEIPEAANTLQDIDLNALTGTWILRSSVAYFNIFETGGKYYIAFTVPHGSSAQYLPRPAELTANGEDAVAYYSEDNEGNHGTIKIRFSADGVPLITATMNDSSTPEYTSQDELLYLIVTDETMYSDSDMMDYPVYKQYLDPGLFESLTR